MENKRSRQFNKLFIIIGLIIMALIVVFNILTDSFNVFNDNLFKWYSYDFTQNPRTAKITYLKKIQKEKNYKNFIIGASGSSSIPTKKLKEYTGKDYFNCFYYGADLYDTVKTVKFLVENYDVESIIMPFSIPSASKYHENNRNLNYLLHPSVSGENKINFYKNYAFANPKYGMDKIKAEKNNTYLPDNFDVFNLDGSYDKRVRDTEYIGSKEDYIKNLDFKVYNEKIKLKNIDEAVAAIKSIKEMCQENNVDVKFILTPMSKMQNDRYDEKEVEEYLKKVSDVTEYWDFTDSTFENDPRFFYDPSHFRNALGNLILDKIYKGQGEFGRFVKKGDYKKINSPTKNLERDFYIYAFHHLNDQAEGLYTIDAKRFEEFLKFLKDNNIETVKFSDLISYVKGEKDLPEKFGIITFDDGYSSNIDIAYPLLKKYGQVATIFPIGNLMGRGKYPGNNKDMNKHFSTEEAKKVEDVFEFGSHSYFFHQSYKIKGIKYRENLGMIEGEREKDFIKDFREDSKKFKEVYRKFNNHEPYVFAYPQGIYNNLTEVLLTEEGYKVTVTSEEGKNTIVKYLPESLRRLRRVNISEDRDLKELIVKNWILINRI